MKPGRLAAPDGSFGRSAGAAVGRGVILLAVAVVIGIVLLNATDGAPPGSRVVAASAKRDTKHAATPSTTTTVPPPTTVPAPAHAPNTVKVIIANATGATGAGKKAADVLRPQAYNLLAPVNAPNTPASSVFFTPGYDKDAGAIATALGLGLATVKPLATPPPIADTKGANVIVVLGADQAAKYGTAAAPTTTAAKAATASTTTTAKSAATTTTARAATSTTAAPAATTTTRKP